MSYSPNKIPVSVVYTSFTAAATSETINLVQKPAGYQLTGVVLKPTTAFAGTGWSAAILEIGLSGGTTTQYGIAKSVFSVSNTTIFNYLNFEEANYATASQLTVTLRTTGGNVSAGTQGVASIILLVQKF